MRLAALLADEHAPFLASLGAAVVGALLVALLFPSPGPRIGDVLFPALTFAVGELALAPRQPWSAVLRNASSVAMATAGSALGALLLAVGGVLGLWPTRGVPGLLAVWAGASLTAAVTIAIARGVRRRCRPVRLAIIGASDAAAELVNEIGRRAPSRYEVVGHIADAGGTPQRAVVPTLGTVAELSAIIAACRLELLVLAPDASRLRFYDELARNCLFSGIRIADLDQFYERSFGYVPVRSINSCWFQHLLALDRAPARRPCTRTADLAMVIVLGFLVAPLLALLVFLVRRDGGPALFRQIRIGECGRRFMIVKLRTMRVDDENKARWTAHDDPRVTGIGRILRATHIDELPQLLNVLRGEMSIVGPRPEQPALADRLETVVPYYLPRHLVRPGIAGWAQARCGYAGSDDGSMWKICHDLYYLRHRSLRFDIAILAETLYAMLLGESLGGRVGWRLRGTPEVVPLLQLSSLKSAVSSERQPPAVATGGTGPARSQEIFVEAFQSADETL